MPINQLDRTEEGKERISNQTSFHRIGNPKEARKTTRIRYAHQTPYPRPSRSTRGHLKITKKPTICTRIIKSHAAPSPQTGEERRQKKNPKNFHKIAQAQFVKIHAFRTDYFLENPKSKAETTSDPERHAHRNQNQNPHPPSHPEKINNRETLTGPFSTAGTSPDPPPSPSPASPSPPSPSPAAAASASSQMEETALSRSGGKGRLREMRPRAHISDFVFSARSSSGAGSSPPRSRSRSRSSSRSCSSRGCCCCCCWGGGRGLSS